MLNLFEMLNQSQNGQGMANLAGQFGLSQQQAQQAVEALLPAFSQGLKQNASDPYGIGNFLTTLANGQHGQYFDNPASAFTPQGLAEGNGILGQIFGSKDLSRAVAGQAAQATGISQDVLKQMLPALAAMIMGGLSRQSASQAQAGGLGGAGNPFGEIIGQMMRQGGGGMFGGGQPAQAQPDNPFGKILEGMFGGAQPSPQASAPAGGNPWGKILEDMMQGGRQSDAEEPAVPDNPPSGGTRKNPYDDIFGKMFETGRQQRDDYQKGVESIFEQFTKGMDRNR